MKGMTMTPQLEAYTDDFLAAYITALLWSELISFPEDDEGNISPEVPEAWRGMNGRPFDDYFDETAITLTGMDAIRSDVIDFVESNWDDLQDLDPQQTGHDFCMSRNEHGCGFWEHDYGTKEQCNRLDKAAKAYGTQHLDVNRDYMVEVYG